MDLFYRYVIDELKDKRTGSYKYRKAQLITIDKTPRYFKNLKIKAREKSIVVVLFLDQHIFNLPKATICVICEIINVFENMSSIKLVQTSV